MIEVNLIRKTFIILLGTHRRKIIGKSVAHVFTTITFYIVVIRRRGQFVLFILFYSISKNFED